MFNKQNFCHVASNNRNEKKAGIFVYKTTDNLATVSASGYFNEKIIDINLHDLIIHEWHDPADRTKVQKNVLCVTERTLDNVGTVVIKSQWEIDTDQAIADLQQYVDNSFVRKDGTSIMTGPLKFRAGSFEGAIAGGLGDGISVYKLKADGSIDSEVASLTQMNGFVPGTNNAMNIGRANYKWKDAYIARVITAVLNNGYDIGVPVTNSADTLALKSQVDLAANSGSQLYTTGVWYAKMYAASTVPTGAEYDGRNYADFSQVDSDNNPIIVIYEGQNGSWTELTRITPPATYNGYVTVTSKIWDIVEQTDQQGGQILWSYNQKTFTPYPKIVSLLNQANTDLDNLTDTGKNIANWSSNVTKCITDIPQDIKLELNAGTLTLKAGSKVYVPNGSGVFDVVTIASDLTTTGRGSDYTGTVYYDYTNGTLYWYASSFDESGTTPSSDCIFYNTSTNKIYRYTSGVQEEQLSFPLAHITVSGGVITEIQQVFNGWGHIGSTRFVLPNIKWLSPDGRNADGTLKSIQRTNTNVLVETLSSGTANSIVMVLATGSIWTSGKYIESETEPSGSYIVWYKPSENILRSKAEGGWSINNNIVVYGYYDTVSNQITSFRTKQPFHAVDYNDITNIFNLIYPIGSVYIGTQNTCPMSLVIPGSTWQLVATDRALWGGNGSNGNSTIAAGLPNITGVLSSIATGGTGTGVFTVTANGHHGDDGGQLTYSEVSFSAQTSNAIYGASNTVQPPAYVVNVWRRTA